MSAAISWPGLAVLALGAFHGINPGMGWLFAVALGLQERERRAVWRALLPLALGHAAALAAALAGAALLGLVLPLTVLRGAVGAALLVFGLYRLARNRHPRYGGMRVGTRDLAIWSFLMASAHGAGLMVLPFVLAAGDPAHAGHLAGDVAHAAHADHAQAMLHAGLAAGPSDALLATLLHSAAYLGVTGLVAVVVYERLGLRLLRSAWINLDIVWAASLVATAILTFVL